MRYVYLRLFLTHVEQPELLVRAGDLPARPERDEFLQDVFNRRWRFNHRGDDLIYVPVNRDETDARRFTYGRIGKQVRSVENAGPDEEFEELERTGWRASNVIVNTQSDTEGQKVAIEDRGDVGKPLAIFNSLVSHVNEWSEDFGWFLSVNQMIEQKSFWEVVERYKGEITRAEFNYITPNVLGIRSEINKRLREYRSKENAQAVSVVLSEPKGDLQLHTDEVKDALEYTSEGGGSVKLKSGRDVIFDSEDNQKAKSFETDDAAAMETAEGRSGLAKKIFD